MRAPAHICTSVTVTAIGMSFADINIFSDLTLLIPTVLISLLPDIDHPSSLYGKMIPPLSSYLSRVFGHRTITHSLLFFFALLIPIRIIQFTFFPDFSLSLIFTLSYLTHLFVDMMTIEGVPLFYPFLKNKCVVPGNPSYRLSTNNLNHEVLVIAFCALSSVFMYDLFEQGFWTTYNSKFNNMKHLIHEFKRSNDLLEVHLKIREFSNLYDKEGLLIYVDASELVLSENNRLVSYDLNQLNIREVTFNHTGLVAQTQSKTFTNIDQEDFNIIMDAIIIDCLMISDDDFIGIADGKPFQNKIVQLSYPDLIRFVSFPNVNQVDVKLLEIDCI